MASTTVQFTVDFVCKYVLKTVHSYPTCYLDNPNNFPTTHRNPHVGDTLKFISKASNTAQRGGGMALMSGEDFLGWVRTGQISQIITKMTQNIPVYDLNVRQI